MTARIRVGREKSRLEALPARARTPPVASPADLQRRLCESEERYRATFEAAAVGIVHFSLDGEIQLVNGGFCGMSGYGRGTLPALACSVLFSQIDLTFPSVS